MASDCVYPYIGNIVNANNSKNFMADTIKIKVKDVARVAMELSDLIQLNENPFKGKARRMLFKLQPEFKFVTESDPKDLKPIENELIDLGEALPPPEHFPDEYEDTISKVCTGLPKKESQISKLLKK